MKKIVLEGKLTLRKEKIVALNPEQMHAVAGGLQHTTDQTKDIVCMDETKLCPATQTCDPSLSPGF